MGVSDPMFLCELALEMGMSLRDLGERESNYNVCVTWPLFFATRRREQERQAEKMRHQKSRGRR
jgi:hypothetical protein